MHSIQNSKTPKRARPQAGVWPELCLSVDRYAAPARLRRPQRLAVSGAHLALRHSSLSLSNRVLDPIFDAVVWISPVSFRHEPLCAGCALLKEQAQERVLACAEEGVCGACSWTAARVFVQLTEDLRQSCPPPLPFKCSRQQKCKYVEIARLFKRPLLAFASAARVFSHDKATRPAQTCTYAKVNLACCAHSSTRGGGTTSSPLPNCLR